VKHVDGAAPQSGCFVCRRLLTDPIGKSHEDKHRLGMTPAPKEGATTAEIAKATDWQNHSIRAFISGRVTKKMGLIVDSARTKPGLIPLRR